MVERRLDLITIGRVSVDLYGGQVGGRLEDMARFNKYVGGCPANIAVGAARLGLRTALLSRVGDEAMGRFIREQLGREGVDTSHLITDRQRLTALVILGIRDRETFPLIFFRENCADMALGAADFAPEFIASARAVVVTGTHFSTPMVAESSMAAVAAAKAAGSAVILDIDYRPVLWGLGGHGTGEVRLRGRCNGDAASAIDPAPLHGDRRDRGGDPHRRRRDGDDRGVASNSRDLAGAHRRQAWLARGRRLLRSDTGRRRGCNHGIRLSDRGL